MNVTTHHVTLLTVESPEHPGARVTWCVHEEPQVLSVDLAGHEVDPAVVVEATRAAVITPKRRSGRRSRYDRDHYVRVASRYRALILETGKAQPLRALADEFGVSYDNAYRWITTCRRMGFL